MSTLAVAGRRALPAVPARRSVWWTAVPFALVVCAVDGYWVTALRGAVGSISRTEHPMREWLVQSTAVLPLYLAAVLVALELARRWRRKGVVAAGLVAGFGSLAGILHLVGDSAFNYRLQSGHLSEMGTMGGLCLKSCLDHQATLTGQLQVRAVVLGSLILVASNVVAVGWLLAMRGGQLVNRAQASVEDRPRLQRLVLVAGLASVTVIHAAVIREHLGEWWAAGSFFIVLTVAEAVNAWLVVKRPVAGLLLTIPVAIIPLVAWSWSRATGLPFGPEAWEREAIGLPDVVCSVLEAIALVQAVIMLRTRRRMNATLSHARLRVLAVGILAVTIVGAGLPLGLFGSAGEHHGGEGSENPTNVLVPHQAGSLNS